MTTAPATTNTLQRKRIIYMRPFAGEIQADDLQLITDDLNTDLVENEILCEAVYIGIDAGLKSQVLHYPDGITMIGSQIAKVIASKNQRFPIGSHIYGKFGWQTHTVTNPNEGLAAGGGLTPYVLPDLGAHSKSLALGCLGLTGNTALLGLDVCKAKSGETLVVSAAAGSVGHLAGQLAKLRGCRTIGITGSDKKCKWLLNEVGFDVALDYRSANFRKDLRAATSDGVDCFFDSVGGAIRDEVVQRMNEKGRIAVCGSLATINDDPLALPKTSLDTNWHFVAQQLSQQGFIVWDVPKKQWMASIQEMLGLLNDGKVRNYENIVEGFHKAPDALKALIKGEYSGAVVVKV